MAASNTSKVHNHFLKFRHSSSAKTWFSNAHSSLELSYAIFSIIHSESKNRLAEIGMQTAAGVQIAIDDQRVRIGMDGTFDNEYTFSEYQKLHIEDVTIEIFTPYEGKHNSVAIELDEGAQFMISSKSSKDSMKLAITRDYGLSSVVGGILGQTIRPNGK